MGTYVITGANRGIGLEYCRQLVQRGETAIAICRQSSPELEDLGIRIESSIDIATDEGIAALDRQLADTTIDVLINNAGILQRVSLEHLDLDSIRMQFEVNAIAPLRVTHTLLDRMATPSKVVLMTSRMGSITDNTSGSSYGYRMSKVALNMVGKSLSLDLLPRNIAVAILHPGWVSTDMTNFTSQGITPAESVRGLLTRIDALTLDKTGTFWHTNGQVLPW
ncbi:MAG: SDR family oxidoreductase [Cyanobacteria bacterium P01_A01_bin.3]